MCGPVMRRADGGRSPMPSDSRLTEPPVRWAVREDGNTVILEITCRDNYEAIELAEVIAAGIGSGGFTLEFENDAE
jgi:hypothetical protein